MACSSRQPSEGEEYLGEVVADFEPGGGKSIGVGTFFKAVTQAVLLFRAETWVMTPRMELPSSLPPPNINRHVSTTADTPTPPASERNAHRGPESVALQYTARPYSASP